jgi:glycosyltransferase involved in cell wall biosynthesis
MIRLQSESDSRPLSLVFYDINDVLAKSFWAGTAAHIIHALRRRGHRVAVVGPHIPFLRRCIKWVVYRYYLWLRRKYYHVDRDVFWTWVYTQIGNLKLLRHRNADAILTCSPPFTAYLKAKPPIVLLTDCTWEQLIETYPHFHPSRQPSRIVQGGLHLDRVVFGRRDLRYVFASNWAADRVRTDFGVRPEQFSVFPFGANFEVEPSESVVAEAIARRGQGPCRLLFVGRDWDRKGGPLAVAIVSALREQGINAELHIIGCSPEDLPAFARAYGLLSKDRAEDRAFIEKMYTECDFFLMPVRAEAQGIVFNEAAAYGLPVIATDVGGVSAVVRSGEWGLLLPAEAPADEYATWIREHYSDRAAYTRLAESARRDYRSRLSLDVYVDRLVDVLRGLQSAPRPHAPRAIADEAGAATG